MRQYLVNVISELNITKNFGETFVNYRLEFARKYGNGLICSTLHGADFFETLLNCIDSKMTWDKKILKGEYEDNFRKIIEIGIDKV